MQEQWDRIRRDLNGTELYKYPLSKERSSVFTLVQRSKAAPTQEGYLLAASNDDERGCNFRYVRQSPLPIVRNTARAIYLRMNESWNAEPLRTGLNMNFSMEEIENGSWLDESCDVESFWTKLLCLYMWTRLSFKPSSQSHPRSSLAEFLRSVPCQHMSSDCFSASTRQIELDDDLHWLVVLVLPAEAFTLEATMAQQSWDEEVNERDEQVRHDVDSINRVSAVLLAVSALFGLLAGWCISAFAAYPLRRIRMYMRKLERLELDGLPGLYPGSVTQLSSLSEAPWEIDVPLHFAVDSLDARCAVHLCSSQ